MKKNLVTLLGIAFVVAIISTGVFYGLFVGKLRSSAAGPASSVVVAAKNLNRGTVLKADDLKLAAWGAATLPQGAFTSLEAVNGLTLIAPVEANEPVLESRAASAKSGAGAGLGIATGMRAIAIHASDSSSIVGMLKPGYRVDVQFVSVDNELRTILENIEVLAINPTGDGRSPVPVVTLLVDPQGADLAGLGDSTARLRLILRNPLDDSKPEAHRISGSLIMKNATGK
jgi:pilus assembly protein CpaB